MIKFFPTRSKHTGFALAQRVHARRLAREFDERGNTNQVEKSSDLIKRREASRTE
jgi:hypothetical protein